jgi:hypothetical protein
MMRTKCRGFIGKLLQAWLALTVIMLLAIFGLYRIFFDGVSAITTRTSTSVAPYQPQQGDRIVERIPVSPAASPEPYSSTSARPPIESPPLPAPRVEPVPAYSGPVVTPKPGESFSN